MRKKTFGRNLNKPYARQVKMKVEGNLLELYTKAIELARNNSQTVGEKNDFYITLQQLEALIANLPGYES